MKYFNSIKYLKDLIKLSWPIFAGNIGQMLINIGDVYIAGHYATNTLAAISVASAIFMTFIVAGFGLTSAITPVLSNYRGEKRQVKELFLNTIIYSQILGLIFFIFIQLMAPAIELFSLNPEIVNDTISYIKISSYSVFGIFLFGALKEFLQAHEIVLVPNIMMICAIFINFALNYCFVFGCGIFPEMGTAGLAVASLIVRAFLGLILFVYCIKYLNKSSLNCFANYIKDLIKVGMPIACAMFVEFFGFNIVAILVGRLEPVYAACHNIIISIVSVFYMIPFSVSSALSVKTGYANGSKNTENIKKYTLAALFFTLIFSAAIIVLYLAFNKEMISFFSDDYKIIELGSSIMLTVACFTAFDSIQSICIGALKGMKKTVEVMIVDFTGYVLISIPLGLIFAYRFNLALEGFWIGLAFGIFSAALTAGILLIKNYIKLKNRINTLQDI